MAKAPKRASAKLGTVLSFAACSVMIGVAVFLPVFRQAKDAAQVDTCMSHLSQIGKAMGVYENDHDDRLPLASTWMDSIMADSRSQSVPTLKEEEFRCPGVAVGGFGYAMIDGLSSIKYEKIKDPQTTVVVFDSTDTSRNAHSPKIQQPKPSRHGFNACLCADGHSGSLPHLSAAIASSDR